MSRISRPNYPLQRTAAVRPFYWRGRR